MDDCIFCQIVRGELPCHKVWESENHLAFLSIFPNTEGVTVAIPKAHEQSYIFAAEKEVMLPLMHAAKTVAAKIDAAFPDVGRCGLVFEGFGVNHLHAKLFPLHGTAASDWKARNSDQTLYFEQYPGYISTNDGEKADDAALEETAERIRQA